MREKSSNDKKLDAIALLKRGYSFEQVSGKTKLSLYWITHNLDTPEKIEEEYTVRGEHKQKLLKEKKKQDDKTSRTVR
jgi:hypothetical protein